MTRNKKFIKIVIFLLIIHLLVLWNLREYFATNGGLVNLSPNTKLRFDIPEYEKYISGNFPYCGGLGNQLFHYTTLYGIGRSINRTPFLQEECSLKEMISIFPNLKNVKIMKVPKNESTIVHIVSDCCDYKNFSNVNSKYIIFKEIVPFRHKFFAKYKNEIFHFLKFDQNMTKNAEKAASDLFKNDTSHKFCIHIRRGDFMKSTYRFQESRADFIINATYQILDFFLAQGYSNVSLVLMGQDDKFKHSLNITKLFNKTYYPAIPSRGVDMAFGVAYCDTYLISAGASTFAWWTAYLMPETRNIFYNGNSKKKGKIEEKQRQKYMPPKWMRIDYE